MFTRARWFAIGAASTIGAGVFLAGRVKTMRERITPETMARAGAITMASVMEATGRRLQTGTLPGDTPPEGPNTAAG
jgi:hypothetical protein